MNILKFDVQFFRDDFLQARPAPFTWGPGDTGEADPRFRVYKNIEFTIGQPVEVGGIELVYDGEEVQKWQL